MPWDDRSEFIKERVDRAQRVSMCFFLNISGRLGCHGQLELNLCFCSSGLHWKNKKQKKKQVAKQRGCSWSSSGSLKASHTALSRPRQAKGPPAPPRDFTGVVSNTIKWRKEVSVSVRRLFAVRDQFYLRGHAGNVFHVGVGADDRRPHHSFPLQEPDWLHRGLHAWRKLKVWSLGQFLFCFLNNFDIHFYVCSNVHNPLIWEAILLRLSCLGQEPISPCPLFLELKNSNIQDDTNSNFRCEKEENCIGDLTWITAALCTGVAWTRGWRQTLPKNPSSPTASSSILPWSMWGEAAHRQTNPRRENGSSF